MSTRSEKWPTIRIDFSRSGTGRTIRVNLTSENALALATELLERAEAGHDVQLKFMGENPRAVNIKSL
jgi:hypothetical protein